MSERIHYEDPDGEGQRLRDDQNQYIVEYEAGEQYRNRHVIGTDYVFDQGAGNVLRVLNVDSEGREIDAFVINMYNFVSLREVE